MKPLPILVLLAMVLLPISVALAQARPEDMTALKAEADKLRAAADATNAKDCTKICLDAARKLAELSDQYFTAGDVREAHMAMDDAGRLAEKAGQSSIETKKHRKDVEIELRKLQKRIFDIEQTLNYEDRPPVHQIVNRINKTRSDILMSMFDMPKKELGPDKKENQ
jgi:hypothetical protein